MNFGQALEALKNGELVQRQGWNGKGMFIFQRPTDEIHVSIVVNNIKSLPQKVKDYFQKDIDMSEKPLAENDVVKFTSYLCMKAADGTIVNGWLASQTDMLAEDWQIV